MTIEQYFPLINIVINGFVALGTIGLALFAFFEIRAVRREQITKDASTIIEWANSVIEWDFSNEDDDRLHSSANPWVTSFIILFHHREILIALIRTGYVVKKTALRFKKTDLLEKLNDVINLLNEMRERLGNMQSCIDYNAPTTPPNFITALNSANKLQGTLRDKASVLIKEVADLL